MIMGGKGILILLNHDFQAHRHSFYLLTRPPLIDWVKLPFWLPVTEWQYLAITFDVSFRL